MSTIAGERPGLADATETAGAGPWARLTTWRPRLTLDGAVLLALFLAGFALRFWALGDRAIHHDESLHATYSWYLFKGRGYEHHPLMHGPLLFHAMALGYLLFGVSDATARFVPSAFGAAMVLMPLLLRPWLGRAGTLAAALLIALSPTLLYFSRFVGAGAQDIVVSVSMVMMVGGVWRYIRDGRGRWLYLTAAGLAIGFTTKEVTYMLAAILVVYLNGRAGADFAAQYAGGESAVRRRLLTVPFMLVAWALTLFWPALGRLRSRLRLTHLPRAADLLMVIGALSAPMFAAGVEVVLPKLGVRMDAAAPFGNWTNEQMWGAISIGGLIALGLYFGLGWRPKEWLITAAIFWGIGVPLFTTFFTNPTGIATGIWGSLDYWLQQQEVRRGTQPVFYYLMLTPVYEYLALVPALAVALWTALRTGRDTLVAAATAIVLSLLAAVVGDGAHVSLVFCVLALGAATYAMRGAAFLQFLVFWLGAIMLGLSAAGEKMPWLEVHVALPLALIAALALDGAVRAAGAIRFAPATRLAAAFGAVGLAAAALTLFSDRVAWANAAWALCVVLALGAIITLAVRRNRGAALAAAALLAAFLGPLSVRSAVVAAFEHGDVPVEMLVYTQSTPELAAIKGEVDRYARESGLGYDLPVIVDATEAFTWPWAWYLRDYRRVIFPDLSGYLANPALVASLPANGVLLAQEANVNIAYAQPGMYGEGVRYKHRWWFPEEYRGATAQSFLNDLRRPEVWALWGRYFLHRIPPAGEIGSIDAVAFFPAGWTPGQAAVAAQVEPEPQVDAAGRMTAGGPGHGRGQFQRPAGITTDSFGNIYVADSLNNRVQKLGPDGRLIAVVGGPERFREPWGLAVDAQGTLYVADTWNHRIQSFDRDGNPLRAWGRPPRPNVADPDPLELYGPRDIAVDRAGNVYVTDTGHRRVVKYSATGEPLGAVGGLGTGPGQFQEPVGIAVTSEGDILVADTWNGRVQRLSADLAFKGEFAVSGWDDRGIENKPYLAVGPDGALAISVPDAGTVHVFAPNGTLRKTIVLNDTVGRPVRPLGVALDEGGRLWVSDALGSVVVRLPER